LECLGCDPFSDANVSILTYLDVLSRFLPNNSITIPRLIELFSGLRRATVVRLQI
jgi:hypothetical protein